MALQFQKSRMLLKNSENEASYKLGKIALKSNIRAQSPFSRPAASCGGFGVDLVLPPNLLLFVAFTTPKILAQCPKWSFSTASKKSAPTGDPRDLWRKRTFLAPTSHVKDGSTRCAALAVIAALPRGKRYQFGGI
jgi:hypothetical protein